MDIKRNFAAGTLVLFGLIGVGSAAQGMALAGPSEAANIGCKSPKVCHGGRRQAGKF
jgi:hypothetical protein